MLINLIGWERKRRSRTKGKSTTIYGNPSFLSFFCTAFLFFLFFFFSLTLLNVASSSPAPIYQPSSTFQTKVKLNNKALESLEPNLRKVASVPNTKEYFASTNSIHSTPVGSPKLKPSYSLQKQQAQVGPSDFEKFGY
ncbi:unnamed protein product [Rhizopus microsporus]